MCKIYFVKDQLPNNATPLRIEGKNYTLSLAADDSCGKADNYVRTYLCVWANDTDEELINTCSVEPETLEEWLNFVIRN